MIQAQGTKIICRHRGVDSWMKRRKEDQMRGGLERAAAREKEKFSGSETGLRLRGEVDDGIDRRFWNRSDSGSGMIPFGQSESR